LNIHINNNNKKNKVSVLGERVPRGRKPSPFAHKQIKELREVGGDGYWRGG